MSKVFLSQPMPSIGAAPQKITRFFQGALEGLRRQSPTRQLDWRDTVAMLRLVHHFTGNDPNAFSYWSREVLLNEAWGMERHGFVDKGIRDQYSDPYNPFGQLLHLMELALPPTANSATRYGILNPSRVMGWPGGHQLIHFWHEHVEVVAESMIHKGCRLVDGLLGTRLTQWAFPQGSYINPGLTIGTVHWRDKNTYKESAAIHRLVRQGQIESGIRHLESQVLMPPNRQIRFIEP